MENNNQNSKTFFQTIPGIITGIAGMITAVTGLIISLNQVHCTRDNPGVALPSGMSVISAKNDNQSGPGTWISKLNIENREVVFKGTDAQGEEYNYVYTILEAGVEPKDEANQLLKIKIRFFVGGKYGENFQLDNFRLSVDGIPKAPLQTGLNEIVEGNSAKEGMLNFDFPNNTSKLKLVIYLLNTKREISLN